MNKGLIQVYCGEGKGKTSSAVGLGVRAAGEGFKVIMIQFLKVCDSGEIVSLKKLEPNIKLFRFEKKKKFYSDMNEEEKEDLKSYIKNALNYAKKVLDTKECDVLILDEILGVLDNKLIIKDELIELLKNKSSDIELIITGKVFPKDMYEFVDRIFTIQEMI